MTDSQVKDLFTFILDLWDRASDRHSLETEILDRLQTLKEIMDTMNAQVAAFKAQVDPILTQLGADLDNVAADVANLANQVADLKSLIAAGSSTLDPEAQAALDATVVAAQALGGRVKTLADSVPDTIVPVPVP